MIWVRPPSGVPNELRLPGSIRSRSSKRKTFFANSWVPKTRLPSGRKLETVSPMVRAMCSLRFSDSLAAMTAPCLSRWTGSATRPARVCWSSR